MRTLGTSSTYDLLGREYARQRRADPSIARMVHAALADARSVLNVGAGTGSYEPARRGVLAVEPSRVMLAQRAPGAAPAVRARAEALPFGDGAFDAATAVLTLHHWGDLAAGLREMRRVARRTIAVLTWDPAHPGFWLVRDYFPDLLEADRRLFTPIARLAAVLGPVHVLPVPVPHACSDGFLGAYWRRPHAYLDPAVRSGMSTFSRIREVAERIDRLRADLESGRWQARNGALLRLDALDVGYRLVVASGSGE